MKSRAWQCAAGSAALVSVLAGRAAAQQITERVSLSNEQAQGNAASQRAFVSADGRCVLFDSMASSFAAGAAGQGAVYVRDRALDTLSRAAFATDGSRPNGECAATGLSRDARYVLFETVATNLLAPDLNPQSDVFLYDRTLQTQSLVSRSSSGAQANNACDHSSLSGDGRRVAFASFATNLDPAHVPAGAWQVYWRDLDAGTTQLASINASGAAANAASGVTGTSISADGNVVAFDSTATNLLAADTTTYSDVYVRDLASGALELISRTPAGTAGDNASWTPSVSHDGRFVAFASLASNLVNGTSSTSNTRVFVFDRSTGAMQLASAPYTGPIAQSIGHSPRIDDSGRFVAFVSGDSTLVPGDTNGKSDAFVRDLAIGVTRRVSLSTALAQANQFVADVNLSADGSLAVFSTAASTLVAGDTNFVADVFVRYGSNPPTTYCTAKPNSLGCVSHIGAIGTASASQGIDFSISAPDVLNRHNGLLFYGLHPQAAPFHGGFLCVAAPLKRTSVSSSGGSASGSDCTGVLSYEFNARIQSGIDPSLVGGAEVFAQFWSRDPASVGTIGLSDALEFVIGP